jgi:hypothetical protein
MVMKQNRILANYFLMICLAITGCSYLQGPSGAEGQEKADNVITNLQIDGIKSPEVYHIGTSDVYITWEVYSEKGAQYFELDTNLDGTKDATTFIHLFSSAIPSEHFIDLKIYDIRVRVIDKKGQVGDWSPSISLIIDSEYPFSPHSCIFLQTGSKKAYIQWLQEDSAPSIIKSYSVSIKNNTNNISASILIKGTITHLRSETVTGNGVIYNLDGRDDLHDGPPLQIDIRFMQDVATSYTVELYAIDTANRSSKLPCIMTGTITN